MEIPEEDYLELNAKVNGSPLPTVQWYKNGVPVDTSDPRLTITYTDDGHAKLRLEKVTPEDSGAYKLVVMNRNGEESSQCAVAIDSKISSSSPDRI